MDTTVNKYIAVSYRLYTVENGESHLVEEATEDKPFQFISGFGVTLDAFERNIASLDKGADFDFELTKDEAYGDYEQARVLDLDREMFFTDRVTFISTYHAKRDSERVKAFDSAYLRSFGMLPTLFSYRGYDTAMIFAPAMYGDIEYDLEDRRFTPLQTTYLFSQPEGRANHVNYNWTRVNYHKDFTITIE